MTCNFIELDFQYSIYCLNHNIGHEGGSYLKKIFNYKCEDCKEKCKDCKEKCEDCKEKKNFKKFLRSFKSYYPSNFNYFDSSPEYFVDLEYYLSTFKIKKKIIYMSNDFNSKYFNDNTISIHIRTWKSSSDKSTNDARAIKRNKNSLLVLNSIHKLIDMRIKDNNNVKFFIAIDDFNLKKDLKRRYLERVFFYKRSLKLSSYENDFVELLLLGSSKEFIGLHGSTFSKWAWCFRKERCQKIIMLNMIDGSINYERDIRK